MNRHLVAAAFAVTASLAGMPAFAAAPSPYLGAAIGGSDTDIDCNGADSCKRAATAYKAFAGYDFGNAFALEGMYMSLGQPKAGVQGMDFGVDSSFWGVGGAFRPEFGSGWSGVVRGGIAFTTSKTDVYFLDANFGTHVTQSFHSTNPYAGAGVAYAIDKHMKLEADLDATRVQAGDGDSHRTSRVLAWTLGASYSF